MLKIEKVDTLSGFQSLKEEWEALLKNHPQPNIFLTWDWLFCWWKHFGRGKGLQILLAKNDQEKIMGIAPLYVTEERWGWQNLWQLKLLGTEPISSEYLDFLASPLNAKAVISEFLTHLAKYSQLDLYSFTDLGPNSNLLSYYSEPKGGITLVPAEICPIINFPPTWEEYQLSLSKHTRQYLRQIFKFFIEKKGGQLRKASAQDVETVLHKLFELHTRLWQSRGKSGGFLSQEKQKFHLEVARRFSENGRLGLYYLELDREIVSILYGFTYADTYYFYQSGFDLNYQKKSPGLAVLYYTIQDCFNSGRTSFDFLRGQEEYKSKWANDRHQTYHLLVPRSPKAKLAINSQALYQKVKRKVKSLLKKSS
jgi:CelD/BcsL family acetyltransferase involved in cellulose biosynthesis